MTKNKNLFGRPLLLAIAAGMAFVVSGVSELSARDLDCSSESNSGCVNLNLTTTLSRSVTAGSKQVVEIDSSVGLLGIGSKFSSFKKSVFHPNKDFVKSAKVKKPGILEKANKFPAPAGTPGGYPTEVQAGTPVGFPTQAPAGTPVGYPTQAPTQAPAGTPVGYPTQAPTQTPLGVPAQGLADAPASVTGKYIQEVAANAPVARSPRYTQEVQMEKPASKVGRYTQQIPVRIEKVASQVSRSTHSFDRVAVMPAVRAAFLDIKDSGVRDGKDRDQARRAEAPKSNAQHGEAPAAAVGDQGSTNDGPSESQGNTGLNESQGPRQSGN